MLLVARDAAKLAEVVATIRSRGGQAQAYACDLTDAAASATLAASVLASHGRVDVLVNNAGRSIRRGVRETYTRFPD